MSPDNSDTEIRITRITSITRINYPDIYLGYPDIYPDIYPGYPNIYPGYPNIYPGYPDIYPDIYPGFPNIYLGYPEIFPGYPSHQSYPDSLIQACSSGKFENINYPNYPAYPGLYNSPNEPKIGQEIDELGSKTSKKSKDVNVCIYRLPRAKIDIMNCEWCMYVIACVLIEHEKDRTSIFLIAERI